MEAEGDGDDEAVDCGDGDGAAANSVGADDGDEYVDANGFDCFDFLQVRF